MLLLRWRRSGFGLALRILRGIVGRRAAGMLADDVERGNGNTRKARAGDGPCNPTVRCSNHADNKDCRTLTFRKHNAGRFRCQIPSTRWQYKPRKFPRPVRNFTTYTTRGRIACRADVGCTEWP